MYKFIASCCFCIVSLVSCNNNRLENYYYPIGNLSSGLIYEYESPETGHKDYVYVQSLRDENKQWRLVKTSYGANFQQYSIIKEKKLEDGMIYEDYMFLIPDSTGITRNYKAQIKEDNVAYPFAPQKDSLAFYRFEMEYRLPPDLDLVIKFVGDRKYKGFQQYNWNGTATTVAVIERKATYNFSDPNKGGSWNQEGFQTEYYAKGIGLIYSKSIRREQDRTFVNERTLTRRYPMTEFLKMANQQGVFEKK